MFTLNYIKLYITHFVFVVVFAIFRLCFVFTILMMIISYLREDTACDQNQNVLVQTPQQQINGTTMAYSESASNPPDIVLQCRKIVMPKRSFLDNLIDCYSIRDNYKMLINCKKSPTAVPIIDGLKYVCYSVEHIQITYLNLLYFFKSKNITKQKQINRRLSHPTIPYGLVYALHSAQFGHVILLWWTTIMAMGQCNTNYSRCLFRD